MGLMNNSVELGAQDGPFLRSATLNLHHNVRTKSPRMWLMYKRLSDVPLATRYLVFIGSGATPIHQIAKTQ
jgi:hypothetical protein